MRLFNKEIKRKDASYYRSLDNSRRSMKRREVVLDAVFYDIERHARSDLNYIEISPWIELEGGISIYDVIVNEKEYFESKGFKFENKNPENAALKRIIISW